MRHLVIAMAALAVLAGGGLTAQRKPYRGVNDTYTAAAVHVARQLEYSRRSPQRACSCIGGPFADARSHAAERQRLWRPQARRLHRLEGVLREPAGIFRHRQSVPADWRRAVPGDPFTSRALGVRPPRKFGHRLRSRTRDQPGASGLRGVHLRHDRLQRQLAARAQGVRRPAREAVGPEHGRPSVVERHSRARLSRIAAVRAARQDWRNRSVGRRHAGLSPRGDRSRESRSPRRST